MKWDDFFTEETARIEQTVGVIESGTALIETQAAMLEQLKTDLLAEGSLTDEQLAVFSAAEAAWSSASAGLAAAVAANTPPTPPVE